MANPNSEIVLKLTLDGKDFEGKIQLANDDIKKLRGETTNVRSSLAEWGMVMTGFNQTLQMARQVMETFKTDIMAGTQVEVLRANFKGSAEDMALFKKAVADTVSEGSLIKLSNYATDLGIDIKQQPILFNLAKQAADKYGGSTEEGFQKIILASEGSTRAIKSLGIENKLYIQIVNDMAKAHGGKMADLDAEVQKQIRLDAILQASKITMNDVLNQRQNDHDKIVSEGVAIDQAKEKFGAFIAGALMPLITGLREAGAVGDGFIGTIAISSSVITGLLPILLQYRISQTLTKTATIATTTAVEGETAALALSGGAILTVVGVLAVLVLGYVALENAMEAVRKKMHDDTLSKMVSEMTGEIDKMTEATKRFTLADNESQIASNNSEIKTLKADLVVKDKPIILDSDNHAVKNPNNPGDAISSQIKALEMQNEKLTAGNDLLWERLKLKDTTNTPPVDSEVKTYEQKVKDYLTYYEGLADYDKKYQQQYEDYLDEQNTYYTETLLEKRGSMEEYSNEEIAMMNEVNKKIQKLDDDKKKAVEETQKLISKSKTDAMVDGYEKDSQIIDDWFKEEKQKEVNGINEYKKEGDYYLAINQEYFNKRSALLDKELQAEVEGHKKIAQAKFDAMPEGEGKDKATIEKQFTEDKSLEINGINEYAKKGDYYLAIDQKHYNARLALAKKSLVDNNAVNGAMLAGYDTFMGNVLRSDMTGADKRMAIMDNIKNYLWQKLTEELKDIITTKAAELLVHTTTETTKTAISETGTIARIALLGLEIVKTLALAAAKMVNAIASIFEWEAAIPVVGIFMIPATVAAMIGLFAGFKKVFGFDQGGLLKKGQAGYFEGNRNEIIAPEENFIQVINRTIIPRVLEENQMSITGLLNNGRELIAGSILRAQNMMRLQQSTISNNSNDPNINALKDMFSEMKNSFHNDLNDVKKSFIEKQFAVAGVTLKTVQDNSSMIIKDLRF